MRGIQRTTPTTWMLDYLDARLLGRRTTWMPDYLDARLPGCQTTWTPDYLDARLPVPDHPNDAS